MQHLQLTRRLRALLYSEPLLKLRSLNDERDSQTHHYDCITLAIYIFNRIVESMGLDDEASIEAVINFLLPLMSEMDALADIETNDEHRRHFARKIIERLIDRSREQLPTEYVDFGDGKAVRRKLDFYLVKEHWISDERTALELSPQAINLYLNAFDFDIEDAQIAIEAVTLSQIKSGRIEQAAASARDARIRSIQFRNKIDQILKDTRSDVSLVDWREEVPKMLDGALVHIDSRINTEENISKTVRERLALLEPDSKEAIQSRTIATLMDDCIKRHSELLTLLINARRVFLSEQARQSFAMRVSVSLPNLRADVLEPLLAAPQKTALAALDGVEAGYEGAMPVLLGVRVPQVFSLRQEISWLLRPARELQKTSVPGDQRIWDEEHTELPRYPFAPEQDEWLNLQPKPIRLSALLKDAAAKAENQALLEYITLATLQAFDGETAIDWQSERSSEIFEYEEFWGDDLELRQKLPDELNALPKTPEPTQ